MPSRDRLGKTAAEAVLVGDSQADLMAAQAAGIEKGLFFPDEHHQFCNFDELASHEPHVIFHHYSELTGKLAKAV